jgi:cytochrome P450
MSAVYEDLDFLTGQPYPMWARARAACPVELTQGMFETQPTYHISRHEDAETVLRDPVTFSTSINGESMSPYMGEFILGMDGAEHRKYRALVSHAFRASVLSRWDEQIVQPTIRSLLDELAGRERADLVTDVTSRYPVEVICAIVGVPVHDQAQFARWAQEISMGPIFPEPGLAASRAMTEYLAPIVAERRAQPRGDLLSELVTAEVDGERLSDERLYGFLRLLLPAGAETTFRVLGSSLAVLLTDDALRARARADRSLIADVIEETLRWETSVTTVARVTTRDTELGGCSIPAGSPVAVHLGSANRDERRYQDPENWRLDRPATSHLSFGWGPHLCLGMHLARLELNAALTAILEQFPDIRLDPAFPPPVIEGLIFRGPTTLPVLLQGH